METLKRICAKNVSGKPENRHSVLIRPKRTCKRATLGMSFGPSEKAKKALSQGPLGRIVFPWQGGLKKGKRLRAPLANAKIVNFRPRCKCVVKRQDKAQGHADLCGRPTWCSILPVLMTRQSPDACRKTRCQGIVGAIRGSGGSLP